jgi:hypothetical protein
MTVPTLAWRGRLKQRRVSLRIFGSATATRVVPQFIERSFRNIEWGDVEASVCGLLWGPITEVSWRDWGKSPKTLIRLGGFWAEYRSQTCQLRRRSANLNVATFGPGASQQEVELSSRACNSDNTESRDGMIMNSEFGKDVEGSGRGLI